MEPTGSEEKASPMQPTDSAAVESAEPKNRRIVPVVCPGHNRPIVEVHLLNKGWTISHSSLFIKSNAEEWGDGRLDPTFEGHKGAVWSAKLNSTAAKAATGAADFSVKLWDAISGDELKLGTIIAILLKV